MGMLLKDLFQFNVTNYLFNINLAFIRKSIGRIMHSNF